MSPRGCSRTDFLEVDMARKCVITGKGVQVGHNVSHSNIKTKRRFLPNLQHISVLSDAMGPVRLRITAAALRTIERRGGIDSYLRTTPDRKLSPVIRRLKRRVEKSAERGRS
jgi:large subunit ribosomal protein L28